MNVLNVVKRNKKEIIQSILWTMLCLFYLSGLVLFYINAYPAQNKTQKEQSKSAKVSKR